MSWFDSIDTTLECIDNISHCKYIPSHEQKKKKKHNNMYKGLEYG